MKTQQTKQKVIVADSNTLQALNLLFEEDLTKLFAKQEQLILYISCEADDETKVLSSTHPSPKNWFDFSRQLKAE